MEAQDSEKGTGLNGETQEADAATEALGGEVSGAQGKVRASSLSVTRRLPRARLRHSKRMKT